MYTHLPGGDMLASLSMLHLLSIMEGLGTDTDMRGAGTSMSSAAMEPVCGTGEQGWVREVRVGLLQIMACCALLTPKMIIRAY